MKRLKYIALVISVTLLGIITVFPLNSQINAQSGPDENEGELVEVLLTFSGAFYDGDVDLFPELITEDAKRHHLIGDDTETGALFQFFGMDEITEHSLEFTDIELGEVVVNDTIERNDYVWVSTTVNGWDGDPNIIIDSVMMARFEDGLIAELWIAKDELAMVSLLNTLAEMEAE